MKLIVVPENWVDVFYSPGYHTAKEMRQEAKRARIEAERKEKEYDEEWEREREERHRLNPAAKEADEMANRRYDDWLMEQLTKIAAKLPKHTRVKYNKKKQKYIRT